MKKPKAARPDMSPFDFAKRAAEAGTPTMTKRTEPSAWARHQAINILQRHPPCLRDDVPMNYFIDDIADRLDDANSRWANRGPQFAAVPTLSVMSSQPPAPAPKQITPVEFSHRWAPGGTSRSRSTLVAGIAILAGARQRASVASQSSRLQQLCERASGLIHEP
jgi:hypothetical protein